jgi:hypothetical protein
VKAKGATNVPTEPAFDEMLARALMPPKTPVALQARVMASVARNAGQDIEQLRAILRTEHRQSVAALRRRLGTQLVEAFVLAGCLFLPARLGVHAVAGWLGALVSNPSPMPAGPLLLGLAAAAISSGLQLDRSRRVQGVRSVG